MLYLNDRILSALREARRRKGLSQRALSAKSGVPQSHISRIEKGDVDLRVSSLIALARALDLELELVPKKSVPAIKSLVRSTTKADLKNAQEQIESHRSTLKSMAETPVLTPETLERIERMMRSVENIKIDPSVLKAVQSAKKLMEDALKSVPSHHSKVEMDPHVKKSIEKAARLMGKNSSMVLRGDLSGSSSPAYSLDDDDE